MAIGLAIQVTIDQDHAAVMVFHFAGEVNLGSVGLVAIALQLGQAAQCQVFARSTKLPDVAEMLKRMAEGFLARALKAEQGFTGNLDPFACP